MRQALGGLTTRGRGLLVLGLVTTVLALLGEQRDVMRVGVLLAALPLAAAWLVGRTRYRLSCRRRLEPARVAAGDRAQVLVQLENLSRLPTGLLLVEDGVPYVLGARPRFVLDRISSHSRRQLSYEVRSELRGRFAVGPVGLRVTDPFGLCELARTFTARDTLVVTPRIETLPYVPLGGEWSGSGESRSRSVASAGEDDAATREYRQGDDLRRVHWRATARKGDLMVRREEQPWQTHATVLLDGRKLAHHGEGPASSFEWALSAAGSIALHLMRRGYVVTTLTETGESLAETAASRLPTDGQGVLLDALAVLDTTGTARLDGALAALRRRGTDGLVVAVLGSVDADTVAALSRVRHGGGAAVAVLLDTPAWSRAGKPAVVAAHAAALRATGWRVLPVEPGDRLASLWPWAARGAEPLPVGALRSAAVAP
ncbi:MAG: DUF58 domain-containing protein [Actinomycetales bacterium]